VTRNRLAVWIGPLLGLLSVSCAENDKSSVAYEPAPPPSSTATPIRSAEPGMAPARAEAQPTAALVQAEEPAARDPDEQIWAVLERVIPEISYDKTPFATVIEGLREELGVNIHVQWQLLDDAGVERDRPVTIQLREVSVERLLRLVLEEVAQSDLRLMWEVDGGVLVIASSEYFGQKMVTRIYDVRDLLRAIDDWQDRENRENRGEPADELLYALDEMVEPNMWVQNGGLSTVRVLNGFLLVRTPEYIQRQVEEFLWMLRDAGVGGSE